MLRASSPTALCTLRQSLLPTLWLSSSSSSFLHKFSTFPLFCSFRLKSLEPNSLRLSTHCFRRPPSLTDPSCPRGAATARVSASFSTESSPNGGREILVQYLLVKEDDLNLLLDIQQRVVVKGEDLSDLAVEYSICPSKEQGGMLGWVGKGQMVPEFEEAAFGAPLNKVVRCKTKFGWHLLQVLSEREESMLQDIPPTELHVKMQDPKFVQEAQLIDVREPEEVYMLHNPCYFFRFCS